MPTCCLGFAEARSVGVPGAPSFGTCCTVASAGTVTSRRRFSCDWCWRIGQALTAASFSCTASSVTDTIVPRSSSVNGIPRGAEKSRCVARCSHG